MEYTEALTLTISTKGICRCIRIRSLPLEVTFSHLIVRTFGDVLTMVNKTNNNKYNKKKCLIKKLIIINVVLPVWNLKLGH